MNRSVTCLCGAAALALLPLAAAAAPTINISVAPSQPDANVVRNADLSEHDGDQPADWEFSSAVPDNFVADWSSEGRPGPGSLHILTRTGKMSGYWQQLVPVKPGESVMVEGWLRLTGGKLLMWLTGSPLQPDGTRAKFDERYYAQSMKTFFLAPVWIKREYLRGPDPDEWFLVHKAITIPEGMEALKVGFGSYFEAGEMWVDDIYCGPALADVEVSVTGGEAEADRITRVEIMSIPGPALVHDFGEIAPVAQWSSKATGLDASLDLIVRVTTAGGARTAQRVFPDPRGIN